MSQGYTLPNSIFWSRPVPLAIYDSVTITFIFIISLAIRTTRNCRHLRVAAKPAWPATPQP